MLREEVSIFLLIFFIFIYIFFVAIYAFVCFVGKHNVHELNHENY